VSAYLDWFPARISAEDDGAFENARIYLGVENILNDRSPSLASYDEFNGVTVYPEDGIRWRTGFSLSY
jgi:outer membrane receptor protein involved in Fe transport